MRVLVTGTRTFSARGIIARALDRLPPGSTIVHGAARGADSIAGAYAGETEGLVEEPYPADWDRYGKGAGSIRNKSMLDSNPEVVFAFVGAEEISTVGTANMVLQALRAGRPVHLFDERGREQYLSSQDLGGQK